VVAENVVVGIERRLAIARAAIATLLLTSIALSPNLWTADRSFPTLPALPALPALANGPTLLLSAALVAAVAAFPWRSTHRVSVPLALVGAALLCMFDLNRLQPWFFQSVLLIVAASRTNRREAWALASIILVATYLWSGLQKLNLAFAERVFPWLMEPIGGQPLQPAWLFAPLAEVSAAVLLAFPRTRRAGLVLIVGMHGFLLFVLGPLGHRYNSVVWPWNVATPLIAFALLYRNPDALLPNLSRSGLSRGVLVVVGILPALSFFGRWDENLSHALYSGRSRQAFLILSEEGVRRLPPDALPFVQRRPDRIAIDVSRWAIASLNVPPYAEVRTYRAVGQSLIRRGVPPNAIRLLVSKRRGFADRASAYEVVPLE